MQGGASTNGVSQSGLNIVIIFKHSFFIYCLVSRMISLSYLNTHGTGARHARHIELCSAPYFTRCLELWASSYKLPPSV